MTIPAVPEAACSVASRRRPAEDDPVISTHRGHGHAIAKHIQSSSETLRIETGSLYPALHRLEAQGLVRPAWRLSDKGKRAKYYQLTPAGKRHLTAEHSRWEQFVLAMRRVLLPSE